MAKKKDKPKAEKVIKAIRIPYTDDETKQLGLQMCQAMDDIDDIENEMKADAAAHKQRIQAKETEIKSLKEDMKKGYKMEERECTVVKDYEGGTIQYWFDGELIQEDKMTADDYQTELNIVDEANKKEEERLAKLENNSDALGEPVDPNAIIENVEASHTTKSDDDPM
jgi:hypothetical protein